MFLLAILLSARLLLTDLTLVETGGAKVTIVLPDNPGAELRYAASELADFIKRMSGAELPCVTGAHDGPRILLGHLSSGLAEDHLRITCDGRSLRLDGGGVYGPLQAVYSFLREEMGVFWPFMEEMWLEIPRQSTITVPTLSIDREAYFKLRNLHTFPRDYDRLFHWMAFNGWKTRAQNPPGYSHLSAMLARGIQPLFGTHSWAFWSGRKALNEHLDWNPLLNGKRTPPPLEGPPWWKYSQLCIGNADLRRHLLANMLDYLAKNPKLKRLPLEANDGGGYCDCNLCRAYCENPNDRVFKFFKEMAYAIGGEHPDVTVGVNGYGNHEEPPPFPLPSNLYVSVTFNERNYMRPLTAPVNREYYARLEKWAKAVPGRASSREMGHKVFFNDWLHPFDDVLAEDVKTYARLGLAGFFAEGLYPSPLTEYLRIQFHWDPWQDVEALTMKFCRGLYGAAFQPMYDYYRLLNRRVAQCEDDLDNFGSIGEFVAPIAKQTHELLMTAATLVADSPTLLARVRWEQGKFEQLASAPRMWFPCERDFVTDGLRAASLLPNGDFEKGMQDIIQDTPHGEGGEFKYTITQGEAYHGNKAGCITVVKPGWGRMMMTANGLDPAKRYAFLAAVKTTDGADMVHLWYSTKGKRAVLCRMGDTGGKWYRAVFKDIQTDKGELTLYLTLHTDPKKGRVLFDDVLVIEQELLPETIGD